ncbi:hypothetical protein BJ508DRAFT_308399 [Ascobolus immersus RN42]|uniref:J domain-containing protein n=1 Tax=Ascobolus immersus RN42 TaxID=1160509 RepID=A0A3N4I032_ASCIM|nr:hypothetical protein BJ508DRAFT_308399 [Ascobolus immersus RN42]
MLPPEKLDFYDILSIQQTATVKEITQAYKKLAILLHPDKNKKADAHEKFCQLNDAYNTLRDTSKRWDYDREYPAIKLKWTAYRTWQAQHTKQSNPKPTPKKQPGSSSDWQGWSAGGNWSHAPPPKSEQDSEPDFARKIWTTYEERRRREQSSLAEEAFYAKINILRQRMTPLKDEISRLEKLMKEDDDNPMPPEPAMFAFGSWFEAVRGVPSAAYVEAKREWEDLKRQRETRKSIRESLIKTAQKQLAPLESEADLLRAARTARKATEEEESKEQGRLKERLRLWKAEHEAAARRKREQEAYERAEKLRREREEAARESRRKAAEEAERLRKEKAERERKAREEEERVLREHLEAQRKAKMEAERLRRQREEEERLRQANIKLEQARQRAELARKRREAEEAERARQERIKVEQARKKREAEDLAAWERVEAKKEQHRRAELLKQQMRDSAAARERSAHFSRTETKESIDAEMIQKMLAEQAEKYEAMMKRLKEDLENALQKEREERPKTNGSGVGAGSVRDPGTPNISTGPAPPITPRHSSKQPTGPGSQADTQRKQKTWQNWTEDGPINVRESASTVETDSPLPNRAGVRQSKNPPTGKSQKPDSSQHTPFKDFMSQRRPSSSAFNAREETLKSERLPSKRRSTSSTIPSKMDCRSHKGFWPKVSESAKCPHCDRLFPDWILECRGCKMRSCTRCLKSAKTLVKSE